MKDIAVLNQSSLLKGKRIFALQDDGSLRVTHAEVGKSQEVTIDLSMLDPKPARERGKATAMIVGMAIFGLLVLGFAFAALGPGHTRGAEGPVLCIAGFFALPLLLCWHQYLKQSYDLVIFRNPFSGGQIALLNNRPSPDEFSAFTEKLVSEINAHRIPVHQPMKSLSDELKDLARLRQDGVLSADEFETAKRNLIASAKDRGPIGFTN
ncbi:MAG: SHOCT domain-containing protein [Victivallaceae bacterium]|nr:SHOCT domain-containing protein [Victivallaceae bacterium]